MKETLPSYEAMMPAVLKVLADVTVHREDVDNNSSGSG